MKVLWITDVTKEIDWRFWDLKADVYEVGDSVKADCSVCLTREGKKIETVRVVLPFKEAKKLI